MLFLQLSSNLDGLSVILEKPILSSLFRPSNEQIDSNCSLEGLNWEDKIGFSKITDKLFRLELSCKNSIFYPISKQFKSKRRKL